jgi:5-methylcytosine-specific restriction protein B
MKHQIMRTYHLFEKFFKFFFKYTRTLWSAFSDTEVVQKVPRCKHAWIAQGSMNYFDLTHYVKDYPVVYLSVNIAKHQREMTVGDPIYIWRAKGRSNDVSGVIAFGEIVETCARLDQVKLPQYLLPVDRSKRVDAPGKDLKIGIKILERRVTPDEGMILRETVAKYPLLSQTAIIKAGTGSTFSLSEDRYSAYCDLWKTHKV